MSQSPAKSRRERERERRRGEILDAAERVFLESGFATATMDQVAADAEVSKGTLYLYFKSKDELWLAIVLRVLAELVDRYEAAARDTGPTGRETLRALGRLYVEFAQSRSAHFRLGMSWITSGYVVAPDSRNFDTYRALIQRLFGLTIETIERGKGDGSIRRDLDADVFALQMWAGAFGVVMVSHNREEVLRRMPLSVDFDAMVPSFIDLILDSIKPETP